MYENKGAVKMKKGLMGVVSLAAIVLLGACGNAGAKKTNTTSTSKATKKVDVANQWATIQKAGVIKVGTSADFAPFEFHTMVNGKDTIVGSDIDMMNAIGKELGVKVEYVDMDFNAVLAALEQGQVDVAVSGISATAERKKTFNFSVNYFTPEQLVVVNKENADKYAKLASLAGKKVGAQKGSIQETIVKDQLSDSQIVSLAKVPNLMVELKQNSIDAAVVESAVAKSYVAQNSDLTIADAKLKTAEGDSYAVALPKDSNELTEKINGALNKLINDGTIKNLVQKNTDLANEKAAK